MHEVCQHLSAELRTPVLIPCPDLLMTVLIVGGWPGATLRRSASIVRRASAAHTSRISDRDGPVWTLQSGWRP